MFAGFNNSRKRSTIMQGDWDRDGVKNKNDCEPLNFRKQGPKHKKRKWDDLTEDEKSDHRSVTVDEKGELVDIW